MSKKFNTVFLFVVIVGVFSAKSCTLDAWEQQILDKHNEWRASTLLNPRPADELRVRWDTNIAQNAQNHIDNCNWAHSSNSFRTGVGGYVNPWYSSSTGLGENMAAFYGSTQMSNYGQGWFDERTDYDWNTNTGSGVVGHYTALISHNVYAVGCAIRLCTTGSPFGGSNWYFYVCQYGDYPRGNFNNWKPYDQGSGGLIDPPASVYSSHPGLCTDTPVTCNPACTANAWCNSGTCECNTGWSNPPACNVAVCTPSCTANAWCNSGTCECNTGWSNPPACNVPVCVPSCTTNAWCDAGTCKCNAGWLNPPACDTEEVFCAPPCDHGTCDESSSTCDCDLYWGGGDCSTRVCDPVCIQGTCSQTVVNTCDCTTGWEGTACDEPVCSAGCVNGNCVAPDTCQCNAGWSSASCDVPDCSTNGCVHGTCVSPDTCQCTPGWTGADCSTFDCDPSCENGGTCTGPNTCTCPAGYGGAYCQIVNCNCIHGTCQSGPDDCFCEPGWQSTLCNAPICNPECANGGSCVAPNDCQCADGWEGESCSIAVCDPVCEHGVCTAPDTCTCMIGWSGDLCEIVECFSRPATSPQVCSGHGECIGPNTCECVDSWHGILCNHEFVPGAICFGIESSDPTVCSARGSCVDTDTCRCDKGYEGDECEVLVSCKGIVWDDLRNDVCSGNGVCIAKNKCRCFAGWKVDDEGECSARDVVSILLYSTLVPAGGFLVILGIACLIAFCILIFIKRNRVVEYIEVARQTIRDTLRLKGKKFKDFQASLPEEQLDDGYDHNPRKPLKGRSGRPPAPPARGRPPAPPQRRNQYEDDEW